MMSALLGFAVVAGLMTITPGLDTALVLRSTVTGGARAGYATAAGISSGVLVWGVAAAVGVSALLTASQLLYDLLRYAGAGYMTFLGIRLLWARRPGAISLASHHPVHGPARLRAHFTRGFMTNLLNPKIGVFYVAVLPQFLPPEAPGALAGFALASVHVLEGIAWFSALILGSRAMRRQLERPTVHAWTDRITGGVLIAFAARVAASRA